jgi:hypothetical protein
MILQQIYQRSSNQTVNVNVHKLYNITIKMAEPSENLFPSNTTPCRRISTVVQQVSGNSQQNQQPYARSDNSFVNVQNSNGRIDQISINSSPPVGTMVEQYGGGFVLIPETMVYDLTTEVSESNESNLDSAIIISH